MERAPESPTAACPGVEEEVEAGLALAVLAQGGAGVQGLLAGNRRSRFNRFEPNQLSQVECEQS